MALVGEDSCLDAGSVADVLDLVDQNFVTVKVFHDNLVDSSDSHASQIWTRPPAVHGALPAVTSAQSRGHHLQYGTDSIAQGERAENCVELLCRQTDNPSAGILSEMPQLLTWFVMGPSAHRDRNSRLKRSVLWISFFVTAFFTVADTVAHAVTSKPLHTGSLMQIVVLGLIAFADLFFFLWLRWFSCSEFLWQAVALAAARCRVAVLRAARRRQRLVMAALGLLFVAHMTTTLTYVTHVFEHHPPASVTQLRRYYGSGASGGFADAAIVLSSCVCVPLTVAHAFMAVSTVLLLANISEALCAEHSLQLLSPTRTVSEV